MWYTFRDWEEELYNKAINEFEEKEKSLIQQNEEITSSERSQELEFEKFLNIMQNAGTYYQKADKVRKKKITEILFSNIFINRKRELAIKVNAPFTHIFGTKFRASRDGGDRTPGYGSEDRRVAITPHPYFIITLIIPFSKVFNTSSLHSFGISGFVLMNSINSFFTFKTSSYLLIFNQFSIGS